MACLSCQMNPIPQPCCAPPARSFGAVPDPGTQAFGYELVNPTKPPVIQSLLLGAGALALAPRMNAQNKEVKFTARMSVGALSFLTGALWYRYSQHQSES